MKRKTKIIISTVVVLTLVCAGGVWYFTRPHETAQIATERGKESEEQEVVVKINENIEVPKVYTTIVDESGEEVVAEVQENAPPEEKPVAPTEKPQATGSYTNPEAPPTYTKEQTVKEEKPKQQVTQNTLGGGSKAYIEGFGYVTQGGSTQTKTGQSTGDINKMVGSMD